MALRRVDVDVLPAYAVRFRAGYNAFCLAHDTDAQYG